MEKELERAEVKPDEKEPVILEGDAAILLWLEGKDAWNAWMEENPYTDVDFSCVDFSYKALKERFPDNENLQRQIEKSEAEEVIIFRGYKFSGDAFFFKTTFSCNADFLKATFSGEAHFVEATFGGSASFAKATFSGEAFFFKTTFCGDAYFYDATFSSKALFKRATFSDDVDYQNSNFESTLLFEPQEAENIKSLNFKGAAFEKLFTITGNYNCIPDLRQTKTSHHVDLSYLTVKLNRDNWPLKKALNSEDSERLCRLKEIAESNKNHERALAFHADELRAKRLWNWKSWPKDILDFLFSFTSNYGRSIWRPSTCLVSICFLFALYLSNEVEKDDGDAGFHVALEYAAGNALPFLSKGLAKDNKAILFEYETPSSFVAISYGHSGLSFGFLFLIGLGLRNRFRI